MHRPQPGTTLTTTQSTPNKRRQTTTAAHPSPSHQCHTPACYCYLLVTYCRMLQKPKPKPKLWCKTRRSKITKHFATAINITTHLSYFHSCAYSSSSVSVLLRRVVECMRPKARWRPKVDVFTQTDLWSQPFANLYSFIFRTRSKITIEKNSYSNIQKVKWSDHGIKLK